MVKSDQNKFKDVEASRTIDTSPTALTDVTLTPSPRQQRVNQEQHQPREPMTPQVLTLDHRISGGGNKKGAGATRSLIFGLSKPVFAMIAGSLVLSTGAAGYFFSQFLRIPGLQSQIDELETQVDRLESQITRLSDEIDELTNQNNRYEQLNDDLNTTIGDLMQVNKDLNASNIVYSELNQQLNASNQQLEKLNRDLEQQTEDFAEQNRVLNTTVIKLDGQVNELEQYVNILTQQNGVLQNTTIDLQNQTENLLDTNQLLNETVSSLDGELNRQIAENNRLESLNRNLTSIVSFLNETASTIDESFEAISAYLAQQISVQRNLLLETLQNTYLQRLSNWDCSFRDHFRGEPFTTDTSNTSIGEDSYTEVINYIDERIMTELCLNLTDFEQYLSLQILPADSSEPVSIITSDQLISGVQRYTTIALNYYFPDSTDLVDDLNATEGITHTMTALASEDWVAAGFSCDNLQPENKFVFDQRQF